jgi:hypothetical protein
VPIAADAETTDPAVMGVITPGANYHELMSKVVQSQVFGKSGVLGRIISEGSMSPARQALSTARGNEQCQRGSENSLSALYMNGSEDSLRPVNWAVS